MKKVLCIIGFIGFNLVYASDDDSFNDIFKVPSDTDYTEIKQKTMKELLEESKIRHMQNSRDDFADDILSSRPKQSKSSLSNLESEQSSGVHLTVHERYPSDNSIGSTGDVVKSSGFDQSMSLQKDPFVQNLESLNVSRDYQSFEPMVEAVLHKNEQLIQQGIAPTSQAIDQALKAYENFVVMSQIEHDVPTLNEAVDSRSKMSWWKKLASRFLKTETQKTIVVQEKRIASTLAQNVFLLDDAIVSKSVITPQQRDKIAKLEVAYKKPWQRARSWWNRLWNK